MRDSRTGEITPFADNFFRVFMKSQFYVVIAWLVTFVKQLGLRFNWLNFIYLSILASAIFISLSRSFWLGIAVAICLLLAYVIISKRHYFSWKIIVTLAALAISAILITGVFYNIPHY